MKKLGVRYGISFISEEQAKKNLEREIAAYDVDVVAKIARNDWNDALGKIQVQGGTKDEKTVFYTSLYRCYERPINLSEDGHYYSAFDGKIHEDGGRSFYTVATAWFEFIRRVSPVTSGKVGIQSVPICSAIRR